MKETDMVSFTYYGNYLDYPEYSAYGVILSISEGIAKVKYVHPVTKEDEIASITINKLTKIGSAHPL